MARGLYSAKRMKAWQQAEQSERKRQANLKHDNKIQKRKHGRRPSEMNEQDKNSNDTTNDTVLSDHPKSNSDDLPPSAFTNGMQAGAGLLPTSPEPAQVGTAHSWGQQRSRCKTHSLSPS